MQAGARARGRLAQADLARSLDAGPLDTPHGQWGAPFREQEPPGGRPRPPLVTAARRLVQDLPRRRVERKAPRFAQLRLTNREASVGDFHIRTGQMQRLTQPHARHSQSTQERGVSGGSEAGDRGEVAGGGEQVGDLLLTRDVGRLPPIVVWEHPLGRHLGPGVECAAVLGKATAYPEACGPMGGLDALRVGGPA
jgi:hypothetical protein